jgi:uroporphyrinogen decarboxylase
MTPRDIVLSQINHKETEFLPFSLSIEGGDLKRAVSDHYGPQFNERYLSPYLTCLALGEDSSASFEPVEYPGPGTYKRDLWGTIWRCDTRPIHEVRPVLSEPTLRGYVFPSQERFAGSPSQKEAVGTALGQMKHKFRIAGSYTGLMMIHWSMRGCENALMDYATEPEFCDALLDKLTDMYVQRVHYHADLDADAIMFWDDWCDQRGVIVGPELWRRFMKPRWKRIYDAVHASGKYVIKHCCGSVVDILPDLVEIGLDVLEVFQPDARGMDPYRIKAEFGSKLTFWGGLGSQTTIPNSTPEQLRTEIRKLATKMRKGGGFILEPSKPLQDGTPLPNALVVIEEFIRLGGQVLADEVKKENEFWSGAGITGDFSLAGEWYVKGGSIRKYDPLPTADELRNIPPMSQKVSPQDGVIDLAPLIGANGRPVAESAAYVYIPLRAGRDMQAIVGCGGDWWFDLFLDGEPFFTTGEEGNGSHPPTMCDHLVPVRVSQGDHLLVVRFVSGSASSILCIGGPEDLRKCVADSKHGRQAAFSQVIERLIS